MTRRWNQYWSMFPAHSVYREGGRFRTLEGKRQIPVLCHRGSYSFPRGSRLRRREFSSVPLGLRSTHKGKVSRCSNVHLRPPQVLKNQPRLFSGHLANAADGLGYRFGMTVRPRRLAAAEAWTVRSALFFRSMLTLPYAYKTDHRPLPWKTL